MTDNQDMKERAMRISEELVSNAEILRHNETAYYTVEALKKDIEKAILQFSGEFAEEVARETREVAIRECADIAMKHAQPEGSQYMWKACSGEIAEEILSLLPKKSLGKSEDLK